MKLPLRRRFKHSEKILINYNEIYEGYLFYLQHYISREDGSDIGKPKWILVFINI